MIANATWERQREISATGKGGREMTDCQGTNQFSSLIDSPKQLWQLFYNTNVTN